jgi:DNA polymerase III delta prime subunit
MDALRSLTWCEKYRPTKVSELVGDFKDKIQAYLKDTEAIQNFLLFSTSPGTGKTSTAKAIINELGCDVLFINSSDDRTIDVIREKVKEFARTKTSKPGLKRAIVFEEVDGMLQVSQNALRNIIEEYAANCFFIFNCNNVNKVIDPIKSRCLSIPFAYPNKDEIKKYLEMICQKENLDYSDEGLIKLIDLHYPSIRNCVVSLQDMFTEGKPVIPENIRAVNEVFETMWNLAKAKKYRDIQEYILSSTVDARELNTYFWNRSLKEENIKAIQLTCRNERDIAFGADAKIVLVSSLIDLVVCFG